MSIIFEKGILGFEEYREYEIFDIESNPIFKEIKSKREGNIGFIIVSPFEIEENYDIEIDKGTLNELHIKSPKDVLLYNIVTLNESIESSTINLRAPIVINTNNNLAKQIILQDEKYNIKHPLIRGE
ncbi:MAG: flagellar assembly protein FliW [Paraclostridium sp.]